MKKFMTLFVLSLSIIIFIACSTGPKKPSEKSKLEREVEFIIEKNGNKDVQNIIDIFGLRKKYGDDVDDVVMEYYEKVMKSAKSYMLPEFQKSPNESIALSSGMGQLHLKNNYPSGNTLLFFWQDGDPVKKVHSVFNTEMKIDLKPGKYELIMLVDRKYNDNKYAFKSPLDISDGKLLVGEFNISSTYNKSGQCGTDQIKDDDDCIKPIFKLFDNCEQGKHLVESFCCDAGFNFIMDGKCSRYSDKIENVICPSGFVVAGKGRCCPKGHIFKENKCVKPTKADLERINQEQENKQHSEDTME